jgi:hypothetical protein
MVTLLQSSDNMHRAWTRVNENKGAPDVDNMTIDERPESLREPWKEIRESLREGRKIHDKRVLCLIGKFLRGR